MATLRKRSSKVGRGIWQVLWKDHGRQESATFYSEPAARRFKATLEIDGLEAARRQALAVLPEPTAPPLDEWLETYIAELTDVTEGTRSGYRSLALRYWV